MKKWVVFFLMFVLEALNANAAYIWLDEPQKKEVTQDIFEEGTAIELTEEEVAELRKWIDNAKVDLERVSDLLRNKPVNAERIDSILLCFKGIVEKSGAKENEILIRIILNRALKVAAIVKEGQKSNLAEESLLAFLFDSVELAKDMYVSDKAYLEAINKEGAQSKLESTEKFGFVYAEMLMRLSGSFMNPQAEYLAKRSALGWIAHDLNSPRNLNRALFAEEILRIKDLLDNRYPAQAPTESKLTLNLIFDLRFEYRERLRQSVATKLKIELSKAVAKSNEVLNSEKKTTGQSPVTIHKEFYKTITKGWGDRGWDTSLQATDAVRALDNGELDGQAYIHFRRGWKQSWDAHSDAMVAARAAKSGMDWIFYSNCREGWGEHGWDLSSEALAAALAAQRGEIDPAAYLILRAGEGSRGYASHEQAMESSRIVKK